MKETKFNWKCVHCEKRNIEVVAFQFDVPKYYEAEWPRHKCGKFTQVSFRFDTHLLKTTK